MIFINKNALNRAAFQLHQATENFYRHPNGVYPLRPQTHDRKNWKIVSHFGYDPSKFFPNDTDQEKHLSELLKNHIEARYNPNFKVNTEELNTLFERVKMIEVDIEKLCEEKMGEM